MRTRTHIVAVLATLAAACTSATTPEPFEVSPAGGIARDADARLLAQGPGAGQATDALRSDEDAFYHAETLYAVVLVGEDDVLNVRAGAGVEHEIVETLPPASTELTATGREQTVGGHRWVEILRTTGEGSGWVNAFYLTELVSPMGFCRDSEVEDLLVELRLALASQDGDALFAAVSPVRGLSVRFVPNGNVHHFTDGEAREMFETSDSLDWGAHPYTGEQVHGSFEQLVRENLSSVLEGPNTVRACNELPLGGVAYDANWPSEYANFNFYALHFPGTASYDGLDWVTWVVGVDYSEGVPYVVALERFAR